MRIAKASVELATAPPQFDVIIKLLRYCPEAINYEKFL
jgi:hypothetical protein